MNDHHGRSAAIDAYTGANQIYTAMLADLRATRPPGDRARILQQLSVVTGRRAQLYPAVFGEHPLPNNRDMADAIAATAQVLAALATVERSRAGARRRSAPDEVETAAGRILDQMVTVPLGEMARLMVGDLRTALLPVVGEHAAQITLAIAATLDDATDHRDGPTDHRDESTAHDDGAAAGRWPPQRRVIVAVSATLGTGIASSATLPDLVGWPAWAAFAAAVLVAAVLAGSVAVTGRLIRRARPPHRPQGPEPSRDIHTYFGLTYANYLVAPRTLLQSMPTSWQHRFVALLDELDDAFAHIPQADEYQVTAGRWVCLNECVAADLKAAGIRSCDDDDETTYYDPRGQELYSHDYVFVPGTDPVPHYNRGRAHVQPIAGPPARLLS